MNGASLGDSITSNALTVSASVIRDVYGWRYRVKSTGGTGKPYVVESGVKDTRDEAWQRVMHIIDTHTRLWSNQ